MKKVCVSNLKRGDVVHYYGGRFRIVGDVYPSTGHRVQYAHLTEGFGPTDCAVVKAKCIEGEIRGYFRPGSEWTFQGKVGSVFHSVE